MQKGVLHEHFHCSHYGIDLVEHIAIADKEAEGRERRMRKEKSLHYSNKNLDVSYPQWNAKQSRCG